MKFTDTTLKGLFDSRVQYCIPVYQRAYSWNENQWDVFLEDILEQCEKSNNYSYGNILLEVIEKDTKYDIIDGQQRLTTLIIFMRCVINQLKELGDTPENIEDLEELFIKRRGVVKLSPVENDVACFNTMIVENNDNYVISSPSQEQIKSAKSHFTKFLAKFDIKLLTAIKEVMLKTSINKLELEGKAEAALMFELMNNRGKSLTNMEKLKSYFMYQMYVHSPSEDTDYNINVIADYFKDIYKIIDDIKGLDEDSILIYHCQAFLNIAYGYRNLGDIKDVFKNTDDKVKWIKQFSHELANTFKNLKKMSDTKDAYLLKLQDIGMPAPIYPFIIKGYHFFGDDDKQISELFALMEKLAFRYELIHSRADFRSRLSNTIREFDGDIRLLTISLNNCLNNSGYWSDDAMKSTLRGNMYANALKNYVLWEYEESIQSKGYKIGTIKLENEQIEHISPLTPKEGETPLAYGYDVDADNQYSQEFIDDYLNCIGNLMLISSSHNASIGNKRFEEKLNSYNKNPLLTQQAEIKEFLTDGQIYWKQENIIKRLNVILEFALKRWKLQS